MEGFGMIWGKQQLGLDGWPYICQVIAVDQEGLPWLKKNSSDNPGFMGNNAKAAQGMTSDVTSTAGK